MALQINKMTTTGNYPNAYLRIARIEFVHNLDGTEKYTAFWQAWSDKSFRDNGGDCIDNGQYAVTNADVAQAYTDLKAFYPDAIDC